MRPIIYSFLLLFIVFNSACKDDDPTTTTTTLSDQEQVDLNFMWQEEKLAHDVYVYAYAQHDLRVFDNISYSEQTHMDEVEAVMNKYGLTITHSREAGVFTDTMLQRLYVDLTATCDGTLVDALTVGATIEDLDIYDLDRLTALTSNADLIDLYSRLRCGSTNHMRAFFKNLDMEGADYEPQFISQEDFDSIINDEHQSCK